MDKRILVIGCILAVAILIDVSFTSVVGYSSNNSKSVRASPLYNVRSNRAINEGKDALTCDFLGKGKDSILSFPITKDNKMEILNLIQKMNNKDFDRFIRSMIKYGKSKGNIDNLAIREIIESLYEIRENPEMLNNGELVYTYKGYICMFFSLYWNYIIYFILVIIFSLLTILNKGDCIPGYTSSTDNIASCCLWTCLDCN